MHADIYHWLPYLRICFLNSLQKILLTLHNFSRSPDEGNIGTWDTSSLGLIHRTTVLLLSVRELIRWTLQIPRTNKINEILRMHLTCVAFPLFAIIAVLTSIILNRGGCLTQKRNERPSSSMDNGNTHSKITEGLVSFSLRLSLRCWILRLWGDCTTVFKIFNFLAV